VEQGGFSCTGGTVQNKELFFFRFKILDDLVGGFYLPRRRDTPQIDTPKVVEVVPPAFRPLRKTGIRDNRWQISGLIKVGTQLIQVFATTIGFVHGSLDREISNLLLNFKFAAFRIPLLAGVVVDTSDLAGFLDRDAGCAGFPEPYFVLGWDITATRVFVTCHRIPVSTLPKCCLLQPSVV
jgi:hypothetical protein